MSDIGSPGVDGPPVMPEDPYAYMVATFQAPPSPDYVPGPEEPEQAPPSPVYVPYVLEPVYPEFMPPEDEVLPAEEQPLPAALSPTADSPGYVPESDPEEDPEEDDDEDPEEDPADYPTDGGDDDNNKDESSDDDEDNDPFETDESAATPPPHPTYWVTARISIQDDPPTPFWSDTEVARLLAIPTPPPSLLFPWSSPLPQIPSPPPLPVSPLPLPVSPTYPLGYRAAMIRLRAEAPSTSHSPPPHIILSHIRADTPPSAVRLKVTLLLRKRLGIALGPRYEVGESSSAPTARPPGGFRADYGFVATMDREIMRDLERDVGYGITDTWDEMLVDMLGAPATDETELGRRMTNFVTTVRHDTYEIYVRLDDKQTKRQLMAGRLNMLYRDRRAVITELQAADYRRQAAIKELLAADHKRQAQFIEALKLLKRLQTQMTEFERQQGPAKGPAQPDAPEEAGSSS
ncbi:hypothetical protein Tco_0375742 [Tanacetum coccineum]